MPFDTDRRIARWTSPRYRLRRLNGATWEDTGWDNRVHQWGVIQNEADPLGREFRLGDLTPQLSDLDFAISGSFSNDYHNLIGQQFLIEQYMAPTGNVGTLFLGRCTGFSLENFLLLLPLQNLMQAVQSRTFVWSYFGISPSGTTAYNITNIGTLRGGTKFTQGYGNTIITNNSGSLILHGDVIQFSNSNNGTDTDVGQTLAFQEKIEYQVQQWGTVGAIATLVLNQTVIDANVGDFIYKRKTLSFSGNPGQIVYDILTGSNITDPLTPANINMTEWGAGTRVYQLWNLLGTITQREVFPVLHELAEITLAGITVNAANQIQWSVHRPRIIGSLSIDSYQSTTNIVGDVRYTSQESEMARSVQVNFGGWAQTDLAIDSAVGRRGYQLQPAQDFGHGGYVFRRRVTPYGTAGVPIIINSEWIQRPEEAAILAGRMNVYRKRGVPNVTLQTTLFGILAQPLDFLYVTHPVGSLATALMQITSVRHDLDNLHTEISAHNMTNILFKKGYALWGKGTLPRTASGTSLGAYGTLGTVHNINSQHGTIFRWF